MISDSELRSRLESARTIAVVGLSTDPAKASARVAAYMQEQGYRIIPVHPRAETLLGESVVRSLDEIPEPVDIVDVFRPAEEAEEWARQAGRNRAGLLWLQLGIRSDAAAELAAAAGVGVVMDACLAVEHRRLMGRGGNSI